MKAINLISYVLAVLFVTLIAVSMASPRESLNTPRQDSIDTIPVHMLDGKTTTLGNLAL